MKKKTPKLYLPYVVMLLLFVVLKFVHRSMATEDLLFLLYPVQRIIGLMTNTVSVFTSDGYLFETLNLTIDKSCSGYNLGMIAFLVFSFLISRVMKNKYFAILVSGVVAYVFTIISNTSRIYIATITLPITNHFPSHKSFLHEGIGIVNNLTFLIISYLIIEKITTLYAKSA